MKRVRMLSLAMVLAGISLLVFLSCSQGLFNTDVQGVQESQDKTDVRERAIVTLAITSIIPANSSKIEFFITKNRGQGEAAQ